MRQSITLFCSLFILISCQAPEGLNYEMYRSSSEGERLQKIVDLQSAPAAKSWRVYPDSSFQSIQGFGGAFTESSAHLWTKLNPELQQELIQAYFADSAAAYNMARTHINSCDFSLGSYDYLDGADTSLASFDLAPDREDIIPMIKAAQQLEEDLEIIASPWTASPFMKDNNAWFGGKLKPEFYPTWAKYFVKYHNAMAAEGINIWGYTVENEPLGNDANWESMHYSPEEMALFIKENLGPNFKDEGIDAAILTYDQNRGEELEEWAEVLLKDTALLPYIHGTAVHWYTSTVDWFPESLNHTHHLAPNKAIIQTEACVDAEVPHWQDDAWYWKREATDWGYDWAKPEDKFKHPKYVPVFRYARDIIGSMNSWVEAWVDWNMLLDPNGGPNHVSNWCVAPVLADTAKQELYYTPLYDVMRHFSGFIPRGSIRIAHDTLPEGIMALTVKRPDQSLAMVLINTWQEDYPLTLNLADKELNFTLPASSLQTLIVNSKS